MRYNEFEKYSDAIRAEYKNGVAEEEMHKRRCAEIEARRMCLNASTSFRILGNAACKWADVVKEKSFASFEFFVKDFSAEYAKHIQKLPVVAWCEYFIPEELVSEDARVAIPPLRVLPFSEVKRGEPCCECHSILGPTLMVGRYHHSAAEWYSEWTITLYQLCTVPSCATLTPYAARTEGPPMLERLRKPA